MSKITYIFPSRSRPEKFFSCLDNIKELSESYDYEVIGVFDEDDQTMNSSSVRDRISHYQNVSYYYGLSNSKIEACNREINRISGDTNIICLHSDDMLFKMPYFDNQIRQAAKDYTGLIHFPDGFQNERLCTYPILTKNYLEVDGWIYHPDFKSVYADNFQQALAIKRAKYKFVDSPILNHEHYRKTKEIPDELMKRNDSQEMYLKDRATFLKLKIEYGL